MTDYTVPIGTTSTDHFDLLGPDTLSVMGVVRTLSSPYAVRFAAYSRGEVTNSGTIEDTASPANAILLDGSPGVTIDNTVTGLIKSVGDAIATSAGSTYPGYAGSATISNAGHILSTSGQAIDLPAGVYYASATIHNSGFIEAPEAGAISLGDGGGSLTNEAGGVISGAAYAVSGSYSLSIVNHGMIEATAGPAIQNYQYSPGYYTGVGYLENSGTIAGSGDVAALITGTLKILDGSDIRGSVVSSINGSDYARLTVDYSEYSSPVTVNLMTGAAPGVQKLVGFFHVIGSTQGDDLTSGSLSDGSIYLYTLSGGGGDDHLHGGPGQDTLDGGPGADLMEGGAGDDTYVVDDPRDQVIEGPNGGIDSVVASFSYTLADNVENLSFSVPGPVDGTGNGQGNVIIGNAYANTLRGLGGNDNLSGGGGDDKLYGGEGDDVLHSGAGSDYMEGGPGNDTYYIDSQTVPTLVEQPNEGTDTVYAPFTYRLPDNFENLVLTANISNNGTGNALNNIITGDNSNNSLFGAGGDDTLIGSGGSDHEYGGDGNDHILGGQGDDFLYGDAGNDMLDGGDGANRMEGGSGDDVYYVHSTADQVIEAVNSGTDTVHINQPDGLGQAYVLPSNVENLSLDDAGTKYYYAVADAVGNDLANVITGNVAANNLQGMGGDDTLIGDRGADTLDGGEGNDTLLGGGEKDSLTGGAGNDYLDGGGDADTMSGGPGNDVYIVDSAQDQVVEAVDEGTDGVLSSVTYTLPANVETLVLGKLSNGSVPAIDGTGNDLGNVIYGNAAANHLSGMDGADYIVGDLGNDLIEGGAGTDSLFGGSGDDVIVGGAGHDELTGGRGADIFRYLAVIDSPNVQGQYDLILDFEHGIDKIDLRAADGGFVNIVHVGGGLSAVFFAPGPSGAQGAIVVTGDVEASDLILSPGAGEVTTGAYSAVPPPPEALAVDRLLPWHAWVGAAPHALFA